MRECLDGKHGDFISLDPYIASFPYLLDRILNRTEILNYHEKGYVIIMDRYVSSNMIHQGGKIIDKRDQKKYLTWVEEIEYGEFSIPEPDIIFFLDIPLEFSKKMKEGSNRHNDTADLNEEYQKRSYECALNILNNTTGGKKWIAISCVENEVLLSRTEIAKKIQEKLG